MSKQSLLLVDGDTRSLRVLEVSLRKAGFSVTPAVSVGDALDKLEVNAPDLIISETKFSTELDGFELRRRLRSMPDWAEIPFIFLTAETAIENKIKGLELGVDDYLTKPIYIKEIVTRINILLQKRQRQFLDLRKDGTRFAGRVADMPVVDVIQTIEVSRKSGVIQFSGGASRQAAIYFRDGKVIDAEAGTLQGEDAVYRLLTWSDGEFEVEFRTVRRREVIATSSQGLLMEGMRRLDEWSRLLEQLPPLSHRFEIDAAELAVRLGEVPDDNNRILRLFDSKRTLLEVIDASDFGDLECLQAISRLYFEGLLVDLDPEVRSRRDTGRPGPLVILHGEAPQSPMEEVASGPINTSGLGARASGPELAPADQVATPRSVTAEVEPAPEVPRSVTTGWDVQPEPEPAPRSVTTGWDVQPAPEVPGAVTTGVGAPQQPPPASNTEPPRARRDSAQVIEDGQVLTEEEVLGPLTGGYRPSSLRLIDEAVAAAQLIEPSLFEPEELAAAGITIQPAAPAPSPQSGEAAAIARVKAELQSADPRSESPPAEKPVPPVQAELQSADPRGESPPAEKPVPPVQQPSPANGRSHRKTAPPPIPRAPAVRAPTAKELEEAPLLDATLLTSGEHKLPSEQELDEAPLLDSDLLASGEHKLPSEAELEAAPAARTAVIIKVPEPLADDQPPAAAEEDYSGVPTVIEAETEETRSPGATGRTSRGFVEKVRRDDSQAHRMIGSLGRDRAEASGELKPPPGIAATSPAETQRELVTIMPRRKTGEFPQLRVEDVQAKLAAAKGESAGATADAASATTAAAATPAPAEANKPDASKPDASKPDASKPDASKPKPPVPATPAVEPPAAPPRRVPVEGGVVAPSRGPGRGAQLLIVLASVLGFAAVYSYCRKTQPAQQPVVETQSDAAAIAVAQPDAADHQAFGIDAGIAMTPQDAAVAVAVKADAAVAAVDAGIDKNKEARRLFDKAHDALEEGDAEQALQLLEQSLKLRRTQRAMLERARALQRLGRIDDAVASVDDAIKLNERFAPAHEQKGMILWSAQRYSEARPALERYLELDPAGRKADTIRSMLDEPR